MVQIMARYRPGDKPLSEPVSLLMYIYASLGLNGLRSGCAIQICCMANSMMPRELNIEESTWSLLMPWRLLHICMHHSLSVGDGHQGRLKTVFPGIGIPVIKIRQSWDRLIFIMGIPVLVRRYLNVQTASTLLIYMYGLVWQHIDKICVRPVMLCFVLWWQCNPFLVDWYILFTHISHAYLIGTGAIVCLSQCQYSYSEG